jgi:hypothetical protein
MFFFETKDYIGEIVVLNFVLWRSHVLYSSLSLFYLFAGKGWAYIKYEHSYNYPPLRLSPEPSWSTPWNRVVYKHVGLNHEQPYYTLLQWINSTPLSSSPSNLASFSCNASFERLSSLDFRALQIDRQSVSKTTGRSIHWIANLNPSISAISSATSGSKQWKWNWL